jgi:hypothetical protein
MLKGQSHEKEGLAKVMGGCKRGLTKGRKRLFKFLISQERAMTVCFLKEKQSPHFAIDLGLNWYAVCLGENKTLFVLHLFPVLQEYHRFGS